LVLPLRDDLARQQVSVAGGVDADLPHHLPDDHLDVLVVDVDALRAIDLLDFLDQVGLHRLAAKNVQQLLRADRALGDLLTGLDLLTTLDVDPGAVRDRVFPPFLVHAPADDLVSLDAGQALRDVGSRDATGVEGPHGQLGPRLTDRLGGDDADGLANLDQLAGGQVASVAQAADAFAGLAGQHRAHLDLGHARLDQVARLDVVDLGALLHQGLLALRIQDGGGRNASRDPLEQRLGQRALLRDVGHPDTAGRAAVFGPDDDVLGHVDQPPGQVAGVRRAQRRVRQTLASTVGRDEVLEHRQPFREVRLDRQVDDPAGRVGHQTTHAGQLADLLDVPSSAGVGHHEDRVKGVETLHRRGRHFLRRPGPEVDRLRVPLVFGDQATLELLVDRPELLLGARQDV